MCKKSLAFIVDSFTAHFSDVKKEAKKLNQSLLSSVGDLTLLFSYNRCQKYLAYWIISSFFLEIMKNNWRSQLLHEGTKDDKCSDLLCHQKVLYHRKLDGREPKRAICESDLHKMYIDETQYIYHDGCWWCWNIR